MQKENLVEISGTVETVVYKNEETGFAVLELDKDGELITVVGELAAVGEGEILTLHGNFRTHPSYGTQFKAVAAQQKLPSSAAAILRYLSSGAIKGIGPVLASRMVAQFGDDTLTVLEKNQNACLRFREFPLPNVKSSKKSWDGCSECAPSCCFSPSLESILPPPSASGNDGEPWHSG